MNFNLREPNPGDKISANLIREIVRAIRSLTPIKGPGMNISRGPNGTTYSADVSKTGKQQNTHIILPWTFICTVENAGTQDETRTGGWYNARLQIGLDCKVRGFYSWTTFEPVPNLDIAGVTQTADGTYYAEVDLISHTAELKIAAGGYIPPHDYGNNKLNVYVGTVTNGVQTDGIYCIPCIYTRLD